ncbi:MAG: ABC transporter ATP-binding protein [Deltaproteobacteria bacterium]|nr:ABC transporter ATP-binding protein [Deltaproteobacteria bacterium]
MAFMLELRAITKSYNNTRVLAIPHLAIKQGGVYGIMGPNGAGKTTLLTIVALLLAPTSGTMYWEGTDIEAMDKNQLRKKITLITQNPYLFHTTVGKNVAYGLKMRGIKREQRSERVKACLDLVGLPGFAKRMARELSGGEAQRVAIARALALDPQVLLLDEPTANVDQHGVEQIEIILRELNEKFGITVIVATHDVNQVHRLSDEVIYLCDGMIASSPLENLFQGRIVKKEKDLLLFDTGRIQVALPRERDSVSRIAIPPGDIIVSHEPISTSARNSFAGTIAHVADEGDLVSLIVDVGEKLRVTITKRSFREMQLNVGSPVYVTFKSSSIETF